MQTLCRWITVGLLVIFAPLDSHSQQKQPPPGDVMRSGVDPGDVMQSGGCDNDQRHYIKNGTIDRCAYEKANNPCTPQAKYWGGPYYPLISEINTRYPIYDYEQCGGNSCDPYRATCYGRRKIDYCGTPGDVFQSGRRTPSGTPGDVMRSGGTPGRPPCDVMQSGGTPGRTPSDVMRSGGTPGRTPSTSDKTSDTPTKLDKQTPKSDNTKDPNRHFSLKARVDKVCKLQRLAGLIMSRYESGFPIATVKVVNSNRPTYLVLLPGMELQKPGQATMAGDSLLGYMNLSALDAYRLAIMDAMQNLPPGATLILAGHSLGGIEAQNVVASLAQRYGFKVAEVISFGAPIMDVRQPGTNYLNVRALGDPLRALDRRRNLEPGEDLTSRNGTDPNPFAPDGSHNNYDKNSSGLNGDDPRNDVPKVSTLTTKCYEIDLTTLQGFKAPDLFSRVTGTGQCPPAPTVPPVKCSWQPKAPLPAGGPGAAMTRGLLLEDEKYLKQIAASKCLVILVRDSSPPALRWIGQPGYKPKPEAIKGKTLKKKVLEDLGFPPDKVKQYEGLASARGMTPADRKKLTDAGYLIQPGEPQLILDQDGSKFYSDTDLGGVYDANGNNAWSPELGKELKCGTLDQGIQHPPHDVWKDRNNPGIAGANFGPQIGDCKTMTAILPDGRPLQISTLGQMKQLYKAIGVNFSKVYPYSYPNAELPCPPENQ